MNVPSIDRTHIDAMLAQLKAAASSTSSIPVQAKTLGASDRIESRGFGDMLRENLDKVSAAQQSAQTLGRQFAMGDDSVSLSDVMIASQKASISFQASVQVRNKLVSAYHDIISMQI